VESGAFTLHDRPPHRPSAGRPSARPPAGHVGPPVQRRQFASTERYSASAAVDHPAEKWIVTYDQHYRLAARLERLRPLFDPDARLAPLGVGAGTRRFEFLDGGCDVRSRGCGAGCSRLALDRSLQAVRSVHARCGETMSEHLLDQLGAALRLEGLAG